MPFHRRNYFPQLSLCLVCHGVFIPHLRNKQISEQKQWLSDCCHGCTMLQLPNSSQRVLCPFSWSNTHSTTICVLCVLLQCKGHLRLQQSRNCPSSPQLHSVRSFLCNIIKPIPPSVYVSKRFSNWSIHAQYPPQCCPYTQYTKGCIEIFVYFTKLIVLKKVLRKNKRECDLGATSLLLLNYLHPVASKSTTEPKSMPWVPMAQVSMPQQNINQFSKWRSGYLTISKLLQVNNSRKGSRLFSTLDVAMIDALCLVF